MGSLGSTRAVNGNPVVNGSAHVNGDSPAANGGHLEPIAVVGMSCRLSGDASDTQKLWELLSQGRSAWSKVPKDRFNQEAFHDPSAEGKPGRVRTYHSPAGLPWPYTECTTDHLLSRQVQTVDIF